MNINKIRYIIYRGAYGKLKNVLNKDKYMKTYTRILSKIGVQLNGNPIYIANDCWFDGTDYSLIKLSKNVVISREVMFLTHDYSISCGARALGKNEDNYNNIGRIEIGENSFIGARVTLLPNTIIGENCIIGAGAVVKGTIPNDSIVVGNPYKIIGNTKEWAIKKLN